MSSSELVSPQPPTSFLVTSDPTVQITIYDSTRVPRGQAEGSLHLELAPGLYRVHFERGGRVHHEIVDHEADTRLEHGGPPWQSPVPFAGTATSHEDYIAAARQFSVTDTAPPLGPGPHVSRLFVLVRRAVRDGLPRRLPSEPVTIHDSDGRALTAISSDNAEIDHGVGYVAYACRATPGTYRLRGARSRRDAIIVVPAGRAAAVFIADTGSLRLAELRLALVPVGARFDAHNPLWGAMENVITALRSPSRPLPFAAERILPDAVEDDLCFGIAAAHVLWRSGDRAGLAAVMRHLARYREIPDVAILDELEGGSAWAYQPPRHSPRVLPDTPPLLRASLTLAMTRPELDPGTLSAYSAFAHAARTAVHDSVWCIWSTRTWDERWIEPAVELLRDQDRQRDASSIARSLALATETVEQVLGALDATAPSVLGRPLDVRDLAIPGYTLGQLLGRGARSAVYRARRHAGGHDVALKIVPVPGGADGCARAHGELERSRFADHPQLLVATAQGTLAGDTGIWLEIELCTGSLLDLMSEEDAPLAPSEAHRLVLDVLATLANLHERGIAHGDLKPSNLLLRRDRSVAIAGPDLSVRRATPAELRHATDAPRLAPPELLRDEPPTPASDVWAIAAIYYFLLTLEYPRDTYAHQSQLEASLDNPIVSIAARRPDLPPALVQHIDAALSDVREARPPGAGAFRQQLASMAVPTRREHAADGVHAPGTEDGDIPERAPHGTAWPHEIASPGREVAKRHRRRPIRSLLPDLHTTRGRLSAAIAVGAVTVIGLLMWSITRTSIYSCQQETRFGDLWYRSTACRVSYQRTGNEQDLALAAKAYLAIGELHTADQLAQQLLAGSRTGDAYSILGQISLQGGNVADAMRYAELAHDAHARSADDHGLTDDAILQSRVSARRSDFAVALQAADNALELARRLEDRHAEVAALLSRGDVLRAVGDPYAAEATLMNALELASEPCDRARSLLKLSLSLVDAKRPASAMAQLVAAEQDNQACGDRGVSDALVLSQAWLLRGRDPVAAAAKLDALARASGEQSELLLLRSYLAADRGDLAAAERDLDRAERLDTPESSLQWRLEWARGEVSEQRGDPLDDVVAEHYYRRSIARIATVRAAAPAWSPYLISSRRGPYDELIALLARQGRWRDALAVVLDLDASDMLRATASERVARAIALPPPQIGDVLSAWRAHDLVIVIAPSERQIGPRRERAYRLRVLDGEVTGEDVGDANVARSLSDALFTDPGDHSAARSLGSIMIPAGSETSALCVLAIGPLGRAPLPALRDDTGSLIISRRPLVRVRALVATRPGSPGNGRPVIIADPQHNLPGAAVEGAIVARTVGPSALLAGSGTNTAATRSVLWAAHDAALLHVAGGCASLGRSPALPLIDGTVTPLEMIQHGLAPRIAVLSSSSSATATDEEGWGSVASALLESGTEMVIATDRNVEDQASRALMTAFYAQPDWAIHPAHALARAQLALDATRGGSMAQAREARAWAAFGALGRPPFVPR